MPAFGDLIIVSSEGFADVKMTGTCPCFVLIPISSARQMPPTPSSATTTLGGPSLSSEQH